MSSFAFRISGGLALPDDVVHRCTAITQGPGQTKQHILFLLRQGHPSREASQNLNRLANVPARTGRSAYNLCVAQDIEDRRLRREGVPSLENLIQLTALTLRRGATELENDLPGQEQVAGAD